MERSRTVKENSRKGVGVKLSDSFLTQGIAVPELLRKFRIAKGFTQQGLADRAGVSRKHIAQIERGKVDPSVGILARLAVALDLQTKDLVESGTFPLGTGKEKELGGPRYYLPVFRHVVIGDPLQASHPKQIYREVLSQQYRRDRYILRFPNNEMERAIHRNDLILVENGLEERNGKIVACTVNKKLLVRRYEKRPGLIILKAENPSYDPIIVTSEDQFSVHGVVLEILNRKLQ